MHERDRPEFGALLRNFRLEAGLSQEALAKRARIALETVSALERGFRRAPFPSTLALLAAALNLSAADRARMEAAAKISRVPRLPAGHGSPTNVPLEATPVIGRDAVVAELCELVRTTRLVSLVGAGGVGKTRVAMRVATALCADFADGICFIDLAQIGAGGLVSDAVAAALGVRQSADRSMSDTLCFSLQRRRLLLIFHCCEHRIGEAAALAAAILRSRANIHILTTTREALKTAGEHVYKIPALDVPSREERPAAAAALEYGAVALFVDRVRAADRRFHLDDANVSLVVDICRQIDGIALAIELAAARVRVLGVATLARRLDKRLSLLTGGARTSPPRHQTMRALLDWSYDLLTETERVLVRRVAVFNSGWTLDAVEAVCADEPLETVELLDTLSSLVEKSLVVAEPGPGSVRYRLLDTTREYALEKLEASGEQVTIAGRHARWLAAFAEQVEFAGWDEPIDRWLPRILAELGNARDAMRWASGRGEDLDTVGRIAAGFGKWGSHFGIREARGWIESALEHAAVSRNEMLAARLWLALSLLSAGTPLVECSKRANAIFDRFGDTRRLAVGCTMLGYGYCQLAQFETARVALERARSLLQRAGYRRSSYYAMVLCTLGKALAALGRLAEGRKLAAEAAGIFEELGDHARAANERVDLAELEFAAGDAERALAIVNDSISALRTDTSTGFRMADSFQVPALLNAAAYSLVLGNIEQARDAARDALARAERFGYPQFIEIAIQHLATVAAMRGQIAVAAELCGFCDEAFQRDGVHRGSTEMRTYEILRAALGTHLREAEFARLTADGALLAVDEAVEMALAIN